MKIIVLGSKGFIGKNMLRHLAKTRHKVFPFSRETVDLLDREALTQQFKRVKPDAIINCAAHTGSGRYVNTHAADVFSDNAQMSLNLYAAVLQESPKARVINILSNCSYPGDRGFQHEAEWLQGPVHESIFAYGNAKRTLYYIAYCFDKQYGIRSVNFLIPEVFGPGDYTDPSHTHAVNGMIIRMVKAKRNDDAEFEIWGSGKPIREAMYVDDVVKLLLFGLNTNNDFLYPVNLGQGKGHSIAKTAGIIASILKYKGKLVCNKKYQDGAFKKVLSARKFKKTFPGYSFVDFRKGIKKTIAYYESVL